MSKLWTPDMLAYIREHCSGTPCVQLTQMLNDTFDMSLTPDQVRGCLKHHGLRVGVHPTGKPKYTYPAGMEDFVRAHAAGVCTADLADMVNTEFGPGTITVQRLRNYKKHRHIVSGVDTRFRSGQTSPTKGRHMPSTGRSVETQFKPGSRPHNYLPVGTVVHDAYGYLVRKIAEPHTWEFVHRAVWTAAHGPIPRGKVVTFLDGNKDNVSLDNLQLISQAEHLELTRSNLRFDRADLTEAGLTVVKLKIERRKANRRNKNGKN